MSDRKQLTAEQIERANKLFQESAQLQRDDASPLFRPRLSKPPKPATEAQAA